MSAIQIFVIRAIVGLGIAVLITRIFRGEVRIPYAVGLAVIIVGLAYFAEYLRKRRRK